MLSIRSASVVLCLGLAAAVAYWRAPLSARLPDKAADVRTLQPQLERLDRVERNLVVGYLLRQRGEIAPLNPPDNGPFEARNFRQAVRAQREFLEKRGGWDARVFVLHGLRDQARDRLRSAVAIELVDRRVSSRREILKIPEGISHTWGDGPAEEDKPVLVAKFRIDNLTGRDIDSLTALVSYDLKSTVYGHPGFGEYRCYFTLKAIRARSSQGLDCFLKEQLRLVHEADEAQLFRTWEPQHIAFADGGELRYDQNEAEKELLWGFYRAD